MRIFLSLYSFLFLTILFSCSSPDNETDPTTNQQTTEYTLTVNSGTGGTVSTSGGTYEQGSTVNVTILQIVNMYFLVGRMDLQIIH